MNINTPNGVLSFPNLFAPRARAEGQEPVFSCSIIFDSTTQQTVEYKNLQKACVDTAQAKWGPGISLKSIMFPFRDGGEKEYAGYGAGTMFISPWSKQKPGIVDARLQDVLLPEDVFSGQIVRANLSPYAWTNSGKKGVSFGLNHIQIVKKDSPRIDGRPLANKAFSAVEEELSDSPF